ncbi:MAG TPA: DUF4389 domain-containing protein [Gaiella sp.]|nr:DUF4389 domain-containing protein [Gaiella sp.]
MSTTTDVTELETPERHPIHLVVTDDLQRSRLTVFFRLLLAIPLFIWLAVWGIAVVFVAIVGWVAALVLGRLPDGLHSFLAAYDRFQTHVNAYFFIAANPYPSFTGAPGYPLDVDIAPPAPQSRLTILVRLILAIPAFIVLYVLQLVGQVVGILAWFYALFTGSMNPGMRDLLAYWLRYQAQTYGYALLLTGRYPSFSDD